MSRVGKRPIAVPAGVQVNYQPGHVEVKGPKGQNAMKLPEQVALDVGPDEIRVTADHLNDPRARALMGTVQSVVQNMVTGVSAGFRRDLRLVGVGYRAAVQGRQLELSLGYSKPVQFTLPEGVDAEVEGNTSLSLSSHDKVLLGQTAANIRALRPPEPYQGKGISYADERIRRKAGKAGKK